MTEVWKPVVGYEGLYQVSNLGRVKSLPRKVRQTSRWGKEMQRTVQEKILTAHPLLRSGHLYVRLHKEKKGKDWYVHTLVLTAFVGPRPEGMECLHRDGDPTNNRVENLRWGTRSQNRLDTVKHGRDHNASKPHCPHGHEYSPENTYIHPDGGRYCRTCKRLRERQRYQRKRAK